MQTIEKIWQAARRYSDYGERERVFEREINCCLKIVLVKSMIN